MKRNVIIIVGICFVLGGFLIAMVLRQTEWRKSAAGASSSAVQPVIFSELPPVSAQEIAEILHRTPKPSAEQMKTMQALLAAKASDINTALREIRSGNVRLSPSQSATELLDYYLTPLQALGNMLIIRCMVTDHSVEADNDLYTYIAWMLDNTDNFAQYQVIVAWLEAIQKHMGLSRVLKNAGVSPEKFAAQMDAGWHKVLDCYNARLLRQELQAFQAGELSLIRNHVVFSAFLKSSEDDGLARWWFFFDGPRTEQNIRANLKSVVFSMSEPKTDFTPAGYNSTGRKIQQAIYHRFVQLNKRKELLIRFLERYIIQETVSERTAKKSTPNR